MPLKNVGGGARVTVTSGAVTTAEVGGRTDITASYGDVEATARAISEFRKNAEFAADLGIPGVRVDCVQPPTIINEVDYKSRDFFMEKGLK